MQGNQLVSFLLGELANHKVENLEVIDISGKTSLANHMLIATGRSERHIESAVDQLRLALKKLDIISRVPEGRNSGWVVLDLGDVIVHIFTESERDRYKLSDLWKNEINVISS
ncbi:MAG: ribosome silencing factor [Rickettsiales bacterium]|jgi:ribosome-associated protein|nr:ribosome silencing factor [Rickettsiales bacterium]